MGDCYSVELRMKVAKGTKSSLAGLLRTWMRRVGEGTDATPGVAWNLAMYRRHGIRPDSLRGIVKIILAAHQNDFRHVVDKEGYDLYRSAFNASYGWAGVMRDALREMSWALADGSYLYIDRDEGIDNMEIRKGKIWSEEKRSERELPYASEPKPRRKRHGFKRVD